MKIYQKELKGTGTPSTSFTVDNVNKEYKRLSELGVKFRIKPKEMAPFLNTCGNRIQLVQML
ncbi:VOC family protein [Zobellia uliginosa]|uniref:hypothetical protein n=1 Tax=Zobellia uliginosa TaxID=143224 RepID=UPI0009714AB1|nr:hypothetical protein [Zobellia uliginosa]